MQPTHTNLSLTQETILKETNHRKPAQSCHAGNPLQSSVVHPFKKHLI